MKPDPILTSYISSLKSLSQPTPCLGNQFLEDSALLSYLQTILPPNILSQITPNLTTFGQLCSEDLQIYSKDAELNPPKLIQFSASGERIDSILTTIGWKNQKKTSASSAIVALAYEKDKENYSQEQQYTPCEDISNSTLGPYRRLVQLIKLYIYQTNDGLFACPLAMTDGAAAVLGSLLEKKVVGNRKLEQKIKEAFERLVSREPERFWTSGQWMTEKLGGSDVAGSTRTIAVYCKDEKYRLYGYKWFSSATEADVSLALARIIPKEELANAVSRDGIDKYPVSLFFLKTRKKRSQKLNEIEIVRLKEKLGTRQLPTAELVLNGTTAYLISEQGKGIKSISQMLNITRIYNSSNAVAVIRKFLFLARDFANRRKVQNKMLNELPLQQEILLDFEITKKEEEGVVRMMIPVLKLYTAKEAMRVASEGLEFFGGYGYMENSNLPNIFRDAQVLPIWEGTTNVLCFDLVRAIIKDNTLYAFAKFIQDILFNSNVLDKKLFDTYPKLKDYYAKLILDYNKLYTDLSRISEKNREIYLRNINFGLARVFIAVLLLEQFLKSGRIFDLEIFLRFIDKYESLYCQKEEWDFEKRNEIALDLDSFGKKRCVGDIDLMGKIRPKL